MTKKNFIELAKYIKEDVLYCEPFTEKQIAHLANFCHAQNHRFNRERWLEFIKGDCGPSGGRIR